MVYVALQYLRARLGSVSSSERGASLVEYTLLVALIAVVCIGAIQVLGNGADATLTEVGNEISGATSTTTP